MAFANPTRDGSADTVHADGSRRHGHGRAVLFVVLLAAIMSFAAAKMWRHCQEVMEEDDGV